MLESKSFSSKILLFGEYSILKNSNALAIPYDKFRGHLAHALIGREVDKELRAFSFYLNKELLKREPPLHFNLSQFQADIKNGLIFSSNIPVGYGVGSSGALCAALYERYSENHPSVLSELKSDLSFLETHFHGSSSGIDPLLSYLNSPLLLSKSEGLKKITLPIYSDGPGTIFLLDTGMPRRTGALIKLFHEMNKNDHFMRLTNEVLIPITDHCIDAFLTKKIDNLYEFFRTLSDFQSRYFRQMIPDVLFDIWQEGLRDEKFYLKLCGAGGGGFLLGITRDQEHIKKLKESFHISPIWNF